MKFRMMNINTGQIEDEFDAEMDKSQVGFTEEMIRIREQTGDTTDLIRRTEIKMIVEAAKNSGIFEKHPRCVMVID